jgi:dihydrofolate reductase
LKLKVSAFVAASLDGFIARKNGSIDWLIAANTLMPEGEDCGYREFLSNIQAIVMGRNTFDQIADFNPWPYESKRVIVMSHRALTIPYALAGKFSHSSDSPISLVERLASEGVRHIYVDGGKTIQSFLNANIVTDITITLIPIILGQGIPLFGPTEGDIPLIHVETRAFNFGFVQLKYRMKPMQ